MKTLTAPRAALVTGGSRGIGAGIARRLAQAGLDVAIAHLDADDSDATETVDAIRDVGRRAISIRADVADPAQCTNIVDTTVDAFDSLDVVVAAAGICPILDFDDVTDDVFTRVTAVNLFGTYHVARRGARQMMRQGRGGRIIAVSSVSALVGGGRQIHYTPSKAGQRSLMQSLAIALGPHGITCNSVLPGTILTALNREFLADSATLAHYEQRIPLGRIGTPTEVAGAVAFLASPEAAYINGAELLVDGGAFANFA